MIFIHGGDVNDGLLAAVETLPDGGVDGEGAGLPDHQRDSLIGQIWNKV